MNTALAAYQDRIVALCRRHRVRRLDLVGSAARNDFDSENSDVDFLVEFAAAEDGPSLDRYFGLKDDLEALLGRSVDLIMPSAVVNPYVRANMERDRSNLYAA